MNKVSKESINQKIADIKYQRLSDKITHCIITLENGFQVTGESACVDPSNFNFEVGKDIAYQNAFEKIWELEGYLLQEKLYMERSKVNPEESFKYDPEEKKRMDTTYAVKEAKAGLGRSDWKTNPDLKRKVFFEMFPGTTEAAYKKLESAREVYDELSFMEKYEQIVQPVPTDGSKEHLEEVQKERAIKFNKLCRQELDIILQALKGADRKSRERSLSQTKIEEAVMWLGMDLKAIGTPNPYPESKNPNNTVVEKTADGLKL